MKTYSFTTTNSCNTTPSNATIFANTFSMEPNYSAIIDAALDANIKAKNDWLFDGFDITPKSSNKTIDIIIGKPLKKSKFAAATEFLANLSKSKMKTLHIKKDKIYKLDDGTPIIFFDDSIQIGFDLYYFEDFKNPLFINNLTPKTKETLCTIYTDGLKIEIKK